MSNDVRMQVGGSAWDDGAHFLAAIRDDGSGAEAARRILTFENWKTFAAVLTEDRVQLLQHLHEHPAASVDELASNLSRPESHVRDDVMALASVGLIEHRSDRSLRVVVDAIQAEIRLDRASRLASV